MFEQYAVTAASVADFLDRYYRPDRYTGRGEEYAAVVLASHEKDFARDGYTIISHHDSVTGQVVAFFGPSTIADQTVILDKPRVPLMISTPATHRQAGRVNLARELEQHHIARELSYVVGSHIYVVMDGENGARSKPRRLA